MKKNALLLLFFVALMIGFSCSKNKKPEKLKGLVADVIEIDADLLSGTEPISQIATKLENNAEKTILFSKSNIAQTLDEAKNYRKVFIVVANHSLIKITDFDDCQKSTAWGTCMPKGTSLIQKSGDFEKESDYINNLIGKPDNQKRKMYFFK